MSASLKATKKRMTGKRSKRNFMQAALSHGRRPPRVRPSDPAALPVPGGASALVELERRRVDAVALAGGLGAVVEDVPEVRGAARAVHLRAAHEVARVLLRLDRVGRDRLPVGRPAGPGVELVRRAKQRLAAADATVHALLVVVPVLPAERALGAVLARNAVLLVGELLAPLGVGLDDLLDGLLAHRGLLAVRFGRARPRNLTPRGGAPPMYAYNSPTDSRRKRQMAMVRMVEYADGSPEVRAVFNDIMATRRTDWVNNFWKALATHPPTLRRIWEN